MMTPPLAIWLLLFYNVKLKGTCGPVPKFNQEGQRFQLKNKLSAVFCVCLCVCLRVATYIATLFVVFLCAAIGHHMDQCVDPANSEAPRLNTSRKYGQE